MKKEMWWLIVSLYLFLFVGGSSTDWTTTCPTGCICRWVGGKKAAECREGGFTSIPVGLSDEVQVLDLRGNSITSLRQYVFRDAGLINLNKIKMTHCGIERVDRYAFAELKILIELDLSDNRIQELTMESFETNARLRELQLSDNPLMQLLGIGFPPLLYFQKLSLRNCNLSSIPPRAFEQLTTLEQLDLSGNQFQTLTIDPFAHLQKLKSLALHDNPWKCDCRLKSFRDWTLMNNLLTVQPSTRCTQPEVFAKFEWSHLQTTHFTCSPEILALQISGQATDAYIVGDVGKTITLECLVKGNPPPDVRWVKDTVSMTNGTASAAGKNYYVQVSGDLERWVNLTLTNTHLGDAGEYTCVGENSGGSVERNITLNFEDVPSGAGVGMGMGSEGGTLHGTSWLWILIGSVGALLMIFMLLGLIFCLCTRKPRKDHRTEMKTEGKLNSSSSTYSSSHSAKPEATLTAIGESTVLKESSNYTSRRHHISAHIQTSPKIHSRNEAEFRTFHCTATSPCFLAGTRRLPGRLNGYEGLAEDDPTMELCDVARSSSSGRAYQQQSQEMNHFVPLSPAGTYDLINSVLTSSGQVRSPTSGHHQPCLVNSETQTTAEVLYHQHSPTFHYDTCHSLINQF